MLLDMQTTKGVIVPCYNEASRLDGKAFHSFSLAHDDYFFLFVNDGSSDETRNVLDALCRSLPEKFSALHLPENKGKGEAVRQGLLAICAEHDLRSVGYLDADLSTSLVEYDKLNQVLHNPKYRAVFGSRIKRMGAHIDRSARRHLLGRFFATLISHLTSLPFYDTQCGAKVFQPDFLDGILEKPFISKWLFDVEIILRLKNKLGLEIASDILEWPLEEWIEMGDSKIKFADTVRIPLDLIRLHMTYR